MLIKLQATALAQWIARSTVNLEAPGSSSGSSRSYPSRKKVLKVSYCDGLMSVVHRPCVRVFVCPSVNNFFKLLLLLNHLANFDKTWQGCSLKGPL